MVQTRIISVTKQVRENLIKTFKTTRQTVWRALSYENNSDKSRRIRCAAQKMGGVVLLLTPEVETVHDADGYMRQYMGSGILLELNKKNGQVDVLKDGVRQRTWKNPTISELESIQAWAMSL